jgi:hypothetical protein
MSCHCATFQAIWKVGLAGEKQQTPAARIGARSGMRQRGTLHHPLHIGAWEPVRAVKDEDIKKRALAWNETEPDTKYRKKYATVWRKR